MKKFTRGYSVPVGKPTGVFHLTPGGEKQEWREVPDNFAGVFRSAESAEDAEYAINEGT